MNWQQTEASRDTVATILLDFADDTVAAVLVVTMLNDLCWWQFDMHICYCSCDPIINILWTQIHPQKLHVDFTKIFAVFLLLCSVVLSDRCIYIWWYELRHDNVHQVWQGRCYISDVLMWPLCHTSSECRIIVTDRIRKQNVLTWNSPSEWNPFSVGYNC